ncbi:MAG: 8-oxoguanine deaminase [Candidatus Eisenbacteria bacterium]|nr:8-oxoguanine deaminase [Candidatus Eisenbacteria bacterium]
MLTLIRDTETIALLDPERREIRGGWVLVGGGTIVAVGEPGREPSEGIDRIVRAEGMVLLPGLVNTHHHLYQTLTRAYPGATDVELFDWLRALYPVWARIDRTGIQAAARCGIAELLLSGCTTTSDHHYLFGPACPDPIDATVEAAAELGIRFHATRGSMSLSEKDGGLPPDRVVQRADRILEDSRRIVERYHDPRPGAMLRIALAPCSPFSVDRELMIETARLAEALDVRLHTHLAETKDEERYCLERHGMRPLDLLEELEWLGDRTWIVHGIHFNTEEIARLGKARCGITHCPSSNMRLGSGIAPTLDLVAAGCPYGIGVDGSASNDSSSLIGEVRQALLLGRIRYGPARLVADEVLRWATRGGAAVLGRDDIGRIAPGMRADLALFSLDALPFSGAGDPIAALPLCGASRVHTLFVEGRIVVEDGRLLTGDERTIIRDHREAARRIREND